MIDAIDDPQDGWQFGESTKTGRLELRGEYTLLQVGCVNKALGGVAMGSLGS